MSITKRQKLVPALLCPKTGKPFVNPFMTACGCTFERSWLVDWLRAHRLLQQCPSGCALASLRIMPNKAIASLLRRWGDDAESGAWEASAASAAKGEHKYATMDSRDDPWFLPLQTKPMTVLPNRVLEEKCNAARLKLSQSKAAVACALKELEMLAREQECGRAFEEIGQHLEETASASASNQEDAFWYLQAAAQRNIVSAQVRLAACYENGTCGAPRRDFVAAAYWYRIAACVGNSTDAQFRLGVCYKDGLCGLAVDKVAAANFFRLAAVKMDADAQYFLGVMCETGEGVPAVDMQAAAEWYAKAAAQDHPSANFYLGKCYAAGTGVVLDAWRAAACYKAATQGGNGDAHLYLANCYITGTGVRRSLAKARRLLHFAAIHGITEAQTTLDSLAVE
jgi:TPR repeat protein